MLRSEQPNKEKLLAYIHDNVIGSHTMLHTPFGDKPQVYCDYTASGKPLTFIEKYIQTQVMPMYANTHTIASATGKQMTLEREESRALIKRNCGCDERDALVFVGTGSTSAVNLLVNKLRIKEDVTAF